MSNVRPDPLDSRDFGFESGFEIAFDLAFDFNPPRPPPSSGGWSGDVGEDCLST